MKKENYDIQMGNNAHDHGPALHAYGEPSGVSASTPADVIAAIEANAELREAVRKALGPDASTDLGQAIAERDYYMAHLDESAKAVTELQTRLREAERERDEARAELHFANVGKDHAEEQGRLLRSEYKGTIAKLERELAEARGNPAEFDRVARVVRAMAEWTPECRYGLVAEIQKRWPEIRPTMIAKLEEELSGVRGLDIPREQTERDAIVKAAANIMADQKDAALELRAIRALDEWVIGARDVTVQRANNGTTTVRAYDSQTSEYISAPNRVELARKLGLIH